MLAADRARARLEAQAAVPTARFATASDWAFDGARSAGYWLAGYTKVSRPHANEPGGHGPGAGRVPRTSRRRTRRAAGCGAGASAAGVRLPVVLELFTAGEASLVDTVAGLSVAGTSQFLAAWLDAATDGDDPRFRDPAERNHFSLPGFGAGRRKARGEFDAVSAATIQNALDAWIKAAHADGSLVDDTRSLAELQADALAELVARGAGHAAPARPSVSVLIDHDTLVHPRQPPEPARPRRPRPRRLAGPDAVPVLDPRPRTGRTGGDPAAVLQRRHHPHRHATASPNPSTSAATNASPPSPSAWPSGPDQTAGANSATTPDSPGANSTTSPPGTPTKEPATPPSTTAFSPATTATTSSTKAATRPNAPITGYQLVRPDGSLPRLPLRHRPDPDTT